MAAWGQLGSSMQMVGVVSVQASSTSMVQSGSGCCRGGVSTQVPVVLRMQRSTGVIPCWLGQVSAPVPAASGLQIFMDETGCCAGMVSTQISSVSGVQGDTACWLGKVSTHVPTFSGAQAAAGEVEDCNKMPVSAWHCCRSHGSPAGHTQVVIHWDVQGSQMSSGAGTVGGGQVGPQTSGQEGTAWHRSTPRVCSGQGHAFCAEQVSGCAAILHDVQRSVGTAVPTQEGGGRQDCSHGSDIFLPGGNKNNSMSTNPMLSKQLFSLLLGSPGRFVLIAL